MKVRVPDVTAPESAAIATYTIAETACGDTRLQRLDAGDATTTSVPPARGHYAAAVEGLWFTGGLTGPDKTELLAEYLGEDGRWHRYTPDFVIRRADGKTLIVEIKADSESPDIAADLARHAKSEAPQTREGRKAVALKRWEDLNPDRLAYRVLFADTALHDAGKRAVKEFLLGG